MSISLITLQGLPTATQFAGIERVTTLPAPITLFSPMVTSGSMITPPPSHAPLHIFTGFAKVWHISLPGFQSVTIRSLSRVEWVAVYICTFEAIRTSSPISIILLPVG